MEVATSGKYVVRDKNNGKYLGFNNFYCLVWCNDVNDAEIFGTIEEALDAVDGNKWEDFDILEHLVVLKKMLTLGIKKEVKENE